MADSSDPNDPGNLPAYRKFDSERKKTRGAPAIMQAVEKYKSTLEDILRVTCELAKLEHELNIEKEWIVRYMEARTCSGTVWGWGKWLLSEWGSAKEEWPMLAEGAVCLWLEGDSWELQGEDRHKVIKDAECALEVATKLVAEATEKGEVEEDWVRISCRGY